MAMAMAMELKQYPAPVQDDAAAELARITSYLDDGIADAFSDREEELRHARTLREARAKLAGLFLELPTGCRDYVLEGDLRGPRRGRRWPLERLERCYERLTTYEAAHHDPQVSRLIDRMRVLKHRLDCAREALVLANLRIVPHIVRRFSKGGIPFTDLVQDGHLGLLRAVDRYDPDRGFRFATYAYWWIRRSLSEAFTNHSRLIRLPDSLREELRRLRATRAELDEALGRPATPAELAVNMKLPLRKVKKLLAVVPDPRPIEEIGHESDDGWNALLAGPGDSDPLKSALGRELKRQTQEALDLLDAREQSIIKLRFGFDHGDGLTLSEIGKVLGLSRERVRQIERGALEKIHDWAHRSGVSLC